MPNTNTKITRRDAIKILGAAAGAGMLATLPTKWTKPQVTTGALPAHAQTSATLPTVLTVSVQVGGSTSTFINVAYVVPSPHFVLPNVQFTGKVTSDGGSSLTANGFVWSDTDPNPTLSSHSGMATPGLVLVGNNFVDHEFLSDGSYHVRAYATNGVGTGYGASFGFKLSPP